MSDFALPAAPGFARNILTVARRELRDALRARWFTLYTLAFLALGLGVSYLSAAATGGTGLEGFGRTTAGLINLVLLVVPAMALTAGAGAIASDRERGMLAYVLSYPIARWELLAGKYLGLAVALLASICTGFGLCAGLLAWKGGGADPARVALLTALTYSLALSMLAVGMAISARARKSGVAVGIAVFIWLLLVFITDLGLMAATLAFHPPIRLLFFAALANPLQVFKLWSLSSADASLDVLGPAGLYATDTFGAAIVWVFAASMALWIILPLAAALLLFCRRTAV